MLGKTDVVHMSISDIILQVLIRQAHCCGIIGVVSLSGTKDTTMQHTLRLSVSSGMFPGPYVQGCVADLSARLGGPHTGVLCIFISSRALQLYWKWLLNLRFLVESIAPFMY